MFAEIYLRCFDAGSLFHRLVLQLPSQSEQFLWGYLYHDRLDGLVPIYVQAAHVLRNVARSPGVIDHTKLISNSTVSAVRSHVYHILIRIDISIIHDIGPRGPRTSVFYRPIPHVRRTQRASTGGLHFDISFSQPPPELYVLQAESRFHIQVNYLSSGAGTCTKCGDQLLTVQTTVVLLRFVFDVMIGASHYYESFGYSSCTVKKTWLI